MKGSLVRIGVALLMLGVGGLLLVSNVAGGAAEGSAGTRLDVALGEWSVVSSAKAIRPGRVAISVVNSGRHGHGLRVRSSGDGSGGDRFEARTRVLRTGERTVLVLDLPAGTYDVECFVEDGYGDHEERGMWTRLEVRANAPLASRPAPKPAGTTVRVRGFGYTPPVLRVRRGQIVRWVNDDPAPHTITAGSGAWTSKTLGKGGAYTRRFPQAGAFPYVCALHPGMKASVVVR
jgi:plastocyanin